MKAASRQLPGAYARLFLHAIEIEMGGYSLQLMLQNAGLDSVLADQAAKEAEIEISAAEFAALQRAIRAYYGLGARGSLNRIGRSMWDLMIEEASPLQKVALSAVRRWPLGGRARKALEFLAARMNGEDALVTVHSLDQDLIILDQAGDTAFGQTESHPICWTTLGMIQAALVWALGAMQEVEEIACRAMGDEACKFRARLLR